MERACNVDVKYNRAVSADQEDGGGRTRKLPNPEMIEEDEILLSTILFQKFWIWIFIEINKKTYSG